MVATTDGRVLTGIVKSDLEEYLEIEDADSKRAYKIPKADITAGTDQQRLADAERSGRGPEQGRFRRPDFVSGNAEANAAAIPGADRHGPLSGGIGERGASAPCLQPETLAEDRGLTPPARPFGLERGHRPCPNRPTSRPGLTPKRERSVRYPGVDLGAALALCESIAALGVDGMPAAEIAAALGYKNIKTNTFSAPLSPPASSDCSN